MESLKMLCGPFIHTMHDLLLNTVLVYQVALLAGCFVAAVVSVAIISIRNRKTG